ncbi:MAG: hypothetical protein OEV94_04820 [Deltaproteobacteria bacterium]|nr:hypothetical protein [Deltaproteobacteria bacterium]
MISALTALYETGKDRVVTAENVYQPAVTAGRDLVEQFIYHLLLPGSGIEGKENLDHCLKDLEQGKRVLFLGEHWGNFDVPSFNAMLRREDPRYRAIQDQLIYIAGRQLNESSDLVKMFSEKYARLVIVPRRYIPVAGQAETEAQRLAREEEEQNITRINRAAFRQLHQLKKKGHVFVLFPMGGRYKPDEYNTPVKEVASYIDAFDSLYLLSMDGNTLPVRKRMEEERPKLARVVFRVGAPLDCKSFLQDQYARHQQAAQAGALPEGLEADQYVVNHVMEMLMNLRKTGDYGLDRLSEDGQREYEPVV